MRLSAHQETCTACAGTMILEMASLSRLTGEPIFEQKAHKAMDGLWRIRHRSSDLMGTVLNVQSGDWVCYLLFTYCTTLSATSLIKYDVIRFAEIQGLVQALIHIMNIA